MKSFSQSLSPYLEKLSVFAKRFHLAEVFNYSIIAAIIYWIGNQIIEVGFVNLLANLPSSPLFYLLMVLTWFSLPLSEWWIYNYFWKQRFSESFLVYVYKKVLNSVFVQYSGEVVLFVWIRKKLGLPKNSIFSVIKDNNIISSVSSTILTVVILLIIFLNGYLDKILPFSVDGDIYWYSVITLGSIGLALFLLRKLIFGLDAKTGLIIFSIHSFRFVMMHLLNVLKWYVALPDVPLTAWFIIVSLSLVLSRLPFIPNRDLIIFGSAIEIGVYMGLDQAAFTGLFITEGILNKGIALAMYSYSSFWLKKNAIDFEKEKELLEVESNA